MSACQHSLAALYLPVSAQSLSLREIKGVFSFGKAIAPQPKKKADCWFQWGRDGEGKVGHGKQECRQKKRDINDE